VSVSLERLLSYPFIASRVASNTLSLHGAHFDIPTATLSWRDPVTGYFEKVPTSTDGIAALAEKTSPQPP
jgi:carbonic anhydrase